MTTQQGIEGRTTDPEEFGGRRKIAGRFLDGSIDRKPFRLIAGVAQGNEFLCVLLNGRGGCVCSSNGLAIEAEITGSYLSLIHI